jgi:hypothetical protein
LIPGGRVGSDEKSLVLTAAVLLLIVVLSAIARSLSTGILIA